MRHSFAPLLLLALASCTRPNPAFDLDGGATGTTTSTDEELTDPNADTTSASDTLTESTAGGEGDSSGSTSGEVPELPMPCELDDPDLAACYHFPGDEPEILVDGSSDPVDGVIIGLNALVGAPQGFDYAADVRLLSRITVAETGATDDLDVTGPITFMALYWRRAEAFGRAGILDKEGQYGIFLDESGSPSCRVADAVLSGPQLPIEAWTHLACTYDGATLTLLVNGAIEVEDSHDVAIPQNVGALEIAGNSPGKGDPAPARLDGHIDAVEIWSRSLSEAEVCERAGSVCTR